MRAAGIWKLACGPLRMRLAVASVLFALALFALPDGAVSAPQPGTPAAPMAAPSAVFTEPPALPAVTPSPAPGAPTATASPDTGRRLAAFRVVAAKIAFYSNRYLVEADDDVDVRLGDGTHITGNTFTYDLRLNRFMIAGNVTLTAGGRTIHGAAFAEYLSFDRAYFVPILSLPDRWTFVAGDYAHPLLGREMPGDTFFLPDLSGERIFVYAKRAVIDPLKSVRFTPASLNFGLTFVQFPSYFLEYSANPNFAQNALTGAYADGPLDFAGGEHGLATAHIRYDPQNKIFPAYEQHQVSDNHYLVFSISPLTRPLKTYNFLAYDRISPGLQAQVTLQETAFQHSFTQPLSATAYANVQITGSLPHSYIQVSTHSYYDSLLGMPKPGIDGLLYYGDPSHNWLPYHPTDASASWIGFRHQINRLPFSFQLRSSYGFAHDSYRPLSTLGGVNYSTVYYKGLGLNIVSSPLTVLRDRTGRKRDTYFTASFDKQRQYFSLPHHIDATTTTLSLTKVIDPQKVFLFASYTNQNIGDFWGALQSQIYNSDVVYTSPYTGETITGYQSFRGFGTTRSFNEQLVYTPSPILNLSVTMRENRDFPQPVAGIPTVIGDSYTFDNFGVTPYQFSFDLRYRVNRILVLDIGRSYYFNFAGFQGWSPQFSFAIVK